MKKILVVLTILVLVAGFAFAAVAGSVTASYTVDFDAVVLDEDLYLDRTTASYNGKSSDIEATFTLDTQDGAVKGGDADGSKPYALVEVKANIKGYYSAYADHIKEKAPATNALSFTFKIETFKLIGEDWEINLLNAKGAATDFAKSAVDSVTFHKDKIEENTQYMSYNNAVDYADGISATYKGFAVGVGVTTSSLSQRYAAISLEAKTPEFTFGDVSFQAGAGFSQSGYKYTPAKTTYKRATNVLGEDMYVFVEGGNYYAPAYTKTDKAAKIEEGGVKKFGASAKVAYGEMAALAIDFGKASDADEVLFDLAAKLAIAPVTVDVYFGNHVAAKDAKEVAADVKADNLLSAKAVVDLAQLNEDLPVKVTITAIDILERYLNTKYHVEAAEVVSYDDKTDTVSIDLFAFHPFGKNVSVEASTTIVKDFEFTASYNDMFNKDWAYAAVKAVYKGIEKLELEAGMKYNAEHVMFGSNVAATYTTDLFEVKGGVEYYAIKNEFSGFSFSASIASETLVDGATLKAAWSGSQFVKYEGESYKDFGKLSISCKVEF